MKAKDAENLLWTFICFAGAVLCAVNGCMDHWLPGIILWSVGFVWSLGNGFHFWGKWQER